MNEDHKSDAVSIAAEQSPRWHWRNCRSLGLSVHFWLWPWQFGFYRDDDVYGGAQYFNLGPLVFGLHFSIGNCSANGLERFTGLSEIEAWKRACKWEGWDRDGGGT